MRLPAADSDLGFRSQNSQHSVDMDGGLAKAIGDLFLRKRHGETSFLRQTCKRLPLVHFQCPVDKAFACTKAAEPRDLAEMKFFQRGAERIGFVPSSASAAGQSSISVTATISVIATGRGRSHRPIRSMTAAKARLSVNLQRRSLCWLESTLPCGLRHLTHPFLPAVICAAE